MRKENTGKVIKAGIGYTLGNFLVKGLSFLTVGLFTGIMTVSDYGDYSTLMSYESIFSMLIGFTIHTSFKNAKYRYKEDFDRYISSVILLVLLSTGVFILFANLLKGINVGFANVDLISVNALFLYSAASAFIMCYNSYVAIFYEYYSYLKVALANALGNVALSVFFILVVFKNNTYMGRVVGSTLPMILIGIYVFRKLYIVRDMKKDEILKYWKWGLRYSLPTIPHGISQVVLSQFDRIMIRDMIGSEAAAIYGFAYTIFLVISVVTSSLTGVWEQWFYEQLNQENFDLIKKMAKGFAIIFFCFCLCYMLVSPEVIVILGRNERYHESIYSALPIIASGYFIFLYTFPVDIEYYYARTKLIALCTSIAAVINIVLNVMMIGRFGYISAAYTTLVTYVLYFVLHYYISRRIYARKLYDLPTFVICGILIIAAIPLCNMLLDNMVIRWIISLSVFAISIAYAQKQFKLIDMIKNKVLKRG